MNHLTPYANGPIGVGPQSLASAERVIYHTLRVGFDALVSDPSMVDRLFMLLDTDEKTTIKTMLTKNPPFVKHGFSRNNFDVPQLSVVVGSETLKETFIGGALGADEDVFAETTDGTFVQLEGEYVGTSIEVWITTNHPDLTMYYYSIAWAMLSASVRDVFAPLNIMLNNMNGGDIQPDSRWMPAHIFARRIGLELQGMRHHSFDAGVWKGIIVRATLKV